MDYYKEETGRAWQSFLSEIRKGVSLQTAIGKVRSSYGDALANTIQDKVVEAVLQVERCSA